MTPVIDQVVALIPIPFTVWIWPATAITVALAWLMVWLWRGIVAATRSQVRDYEKGHSRILPVPWAFWPFLLTFALSILVGELVAIQFLTAWPQNVTPSTALASFLAVGNVLAAGWVFIRTGKTETDQLPSTPSKVKPSNAR